MLDHKELAFKINTIINCQLELVFCPSHFGMKKPFYQPNKKNKK